MRKGVVVVGGRGGGVLRNCEERGERGEGELVIVTGFTFLCLSFYDFPFSFFFHLLVKNLLVSYAAAFISSRNAQMSFA